MDPKNSDSPSPPEPSPPQLDDDRLDTGAASALPAERQSIDALSVTAVERLQGLDESARGDTDEETSAVTQVSDAPKKKITMLGDFLLVRKIGEGGMGIVYLAQQVGLDREVAIKVLASHLSKDPKFLERFQREARVMANLDHPHILRCFAVGEAHGFHYLAMEIAAGGSLETWIDRLGKLTVGDALHVIIAAASGLQHAHEHGLIHRDIKPGNVLLTSKGVVKLADLGLVKAMSEDLTLTRSGTGVGTPHYMSIEQMRDAKNVDGRSDIYALGCMLYRCLTGRPPFQGESYIELFEAKDKGKYPPARRFNEDVPRRLDLIIDRMLEKNPKDRHQTCAELIQELQSLGVANSTLSFIADAASAPTVILPVESPKTEITPVKARQTPTALAQPEFWYVKALNFDGIRKLSRKQVLDLIQEPNFDLKATASRSPNSGFEPLTAFREFESTIRAQAAKMVIDLKATRYKHKMVQILKEEAKHQQQQESTIQFRRFAAWIAPLVGLAILSGLGYLAWWAINTFIAGR